MKTTEIYFECNKNTYEDEKEKAISDFMADVKFGLDSEYEDTDYLTYIGNGRYHVCTGILWNGFDEWGCPVIEEVSKNGL